MTAGKLLGVVQLVIRDALPVLAAVHSLATRRKLNRHLAAQPQRRPDCPPGCLGH